MWYHVVCAFTLITLYIYTTLVVSIDHWLHINTPPGIVVTFIFLFLTFLFCVCYTRAWLSDAGKIPLSWANPPVAKRKPLYYDEDDSSSESEATQTKSKSKSNQDNQDEENTALLIKDSASVTSSSVALTEATYDEPPYCSVCKVYKPLRAHHCKRCGRCTLKMDHHCKWINNCVGFENHKFFFLTLVYGLVCCFVVALLLLLRCIFVSPIENSHGDSFLDFEPWDWANFGLMWLTAVLIGLQTFSLGGMFFFHVFLISRHMTHVEWHCCKGRSLGCDYNQGSILVNLKCLLGNNYLLWPIPVKSTGWPYKGDNYAVTVREEGEEA
eukprot:TRINITY_DN12143_c0_g1_i1.p1 TRINITY_DN12143_c0_g1~~TRINITY_DN12143_c0_g1_i1.p1  ORF type:complete len:326 (-),score=16.98 TRINITY_DN12143_c0_g1_i1:65-1042(-)